MSLIVMKVQLYVAETVNGSRWSDSKLNDRKYLSGMQNHIFEYFNSESHTHFLNKTIESTL